MILSKDDVKLFLRKQSLKNQEDFIYDRSPVIIATKLDKINRSQIQKQVKLIRTTLQAGADTQIVPYSAQTKQGREEIYEILDGILAAEDPAQE